MGGQSFSLLHDTLTESILQTVQGRLVDENRTLAMERSHLSDLMGNVQKMHNDLERSGENDRRRLESQLNLLEGQTYVIDLSRFPAADLKALALFSRQDLRTQLTQERDTIRHISLQKDIELKELQNRLDRSVWLVSASVLTNLNSLFARSKNYPRLVKDS